MPKRTKFQACVQPSKDGTITAANASSISDGASALVVTSSEIAAQRNLKPLANILAYASHSQHPSEFTIAPVGAIEKVLKNRLGCR